MLSKHPRDEILFGKGFLRRTDVSGTSVLLVANVGLGRFQRGYQALRLFNGNCFVSVAVKDPNRHVLDLLGKSRERIRRAHERSEERRVGKEGRWRRSTGNIKRKERKAKSMGGCDNSDGECTASEL